MTESWQTFIDSLTLNTTANNAFIDAIYPLNSQRFITINGIDAAKFLQGQLSCDIQSVTLQQSGLGSHSNAKGRMQSSFRICRTKDDAFLLRVHHTNIEHTKNQLSKYIVFSKASIHIDQQWVGIGLNGKKAHDYLEKQFGIVFNTPYQQHIENNCIIICTNSDYLSFEIYTLADKAIELWNNAPNDLVKYTSNQHQLLENYLGLAFVEAKTADQFIPQMFNYQATPAISFKKGCYTGQEIVARMHYLGKIKRHMQHYSALCDGILNAGDNVFNAQKTQSVGDIISAVSTGNNQWDMLINIIDDAAASNQLETESCNITTLTLIPLPYQMS